MSLGTTLGAGIGAGLMYLLDPVTGRRRRALLRDKMVHFAHATNDAMGVTWRDLSNRTRGVAAEMRSLVVRQRRHTHAAQIPGLQGGRRRMGGQFELLQEHWSPTARLIVGTAGAALSLLGALRGGPIGAVMGAGGLTVLARGWTNRPLRRLLGIGAGRRAVDLQKTVHIQAPIDRVFRIWSAYENFPRFMSHVREVRQIAPEWSHWTVSGPVGLPVEWDAVLTEFVPNRLLAWKTSPGSIIQHAGQVHFERDAEGGTRVHIRMSYTPPVGGLGHELAELLGTDPKSRMDHDLLEMKSFVERGVTNEQRPGPGFPERTLDEANL